jgi:hypothetical protein
MKILKSVPVKIKDHGPDIKDFECLAGKGGIPDKAGF